MGAGKRKITRIRAILLISGTTAGLIILGLLVGYAFFWDRYEQLTKNDYELRAAVELVNQDPNNPAKRINLGWAFFQKGDYKNATREYQNALQLSPGNPIVKYNLALIAIQRQDFTTAKKVLEQLVRDNPQLISAHSSLGLVYSELGDYQRAIRQFDFALKFDRGNTELLLAKGDALEGQGDKKLALAIYRQALQYDPSYEKVRQAIQRLQHQVGK